MTTYLRRDEVLAALEEYMSSVETWVSDDERVAAQYHGVRDGVIHSSEIIRALPTVELPEARECPTNHCDANGDFYGPIQPNDTRDCPFEFDFCPVCGTSLKEQP